MHILTVDHILTTRHAVKQQTPPTAPGLHRPHETAGIMGDTTVIGDL